MLLQMNGILTPTDRRTGGWNDTANLKKMCYLKKLHLGMWSANQLKPYRQSINQPTWQTHSWKPQLTGRNKKTSLLLLTEFPTGTY